MEKDLLFVILQALREAQYMKTVHELERESGLFFDMNHFEDLVMNGNWDETEKYLAGFTKLGDNPQSNRIIFLIRYFRYLEALKGKDDVEALKIMRKDLQVFSRNNEKLYNELAVLLTKNDFGKNVDQKSSRATLLRDLEVLIKENPVLKDKLNFPSFEKERLQTLLEQSSHWEDLVKKNLAITLSSTRKTQSVRSLHDLPKSVIANLKQGSTVKSMDFHPLIHSVLLVGTNLGDFSVWEVGSKERLVHRNFEVWDLSSCSATLQASLAQEYTASVNCVKWSPDAVSFGVAYSKHIVHICSYSCGGELQNHLEIDAHVGSVNDLAFAYPKEHLCVVTCGEDKTIKVWDVATGSKVYTFEGHEAPVHSVCIHDKGEKYIICTFVDGKIKGWRYDNPDDVAVLEAPGRSCTTMAYTDDETRLFSCGTNIDGESFLAEWNERDGVLKQSYVGLSKKSVGVLQFHTSRKKYLAVGDDSFIKIWHMDNPNLLATTDAGGELPASPCVRFNKASVLLAVSTSDNGIKVLATSDVVHLAGDSNPFGLLLDL